MDFMDTAQQRFAPLISALMAHVPRQLTYDVENTGGGIMCLFVRPIDPNGFDGSSRCIVFSDEWDEPDPTADAMVNCAVYRDWNDPDDMGIAYWSIIRYEHDREDDIADWATPIIIGWLS